MSIVMSRKPSVEKRAPIGHVILPWGHTSGGHTGHNCTLCDQLETDQLFEMGPFVVRSLSEHCASLLILELLEKVTIYITYSQ
jgi:hypothetical protein